MFSPWASLGGEFSPDCGEAEAMDCRTACMQKTRESVLATNLECSERGSHTEVSGPADVLSLGVAQAGNLASEFGLGPLVDT